MRKYNLLLLFLFLSSLAVSQESPINADNTSNEIDDKRWDISIDLVNRYIWRGQSWGGNFPAAQPAFNFAVTEKLSVGTWATTNFQNEYYFSDGTTPKGYQELDLGVSYQLTDFMSVDLWDYYWPAFQKLEGVDRSYFNYGPNGVKTVDASLVFDFSDGYKLPFDANVSTLVAGNDYRYDSNDKARQNYTTYIELGYTFFNIFDAISAKDLQDINLHTVAGAVLNNQAEYYTYADYDRPSLVNLGVDLSKEFDLGGGITMPLAVNYTYNGATANTELYGKHFAVARLSFYY